MPHSSPYRDAFSGWKERLGFLSPDRHEFESRCDLAFHFFLGYGDGENDAQVEADMHRTRLAFLFSSDTSHSRRAAGASE